MDTTTIYDHIHSENKLSCLILMEANISSS